MSEPIHNEPDQHSKRRRLDGENYDASFVETSTTRPRRKLNHDSYTVGWICALSLELVAAKAMLDEEHEMLPNPPGDSNVYSYGSISGHNIVLACLPAGIYGTTSATAVATPMSKTFRSLSLPLLVGVGGGVPQAGFEIRLGDVAVSVPRSEYFAVMQHDYGKIEINGKSVLRGSLNKPAPTLLQAVAQLQAKHILEPIDLSQHTRRALARFPHGLSEFAHPGPQFDVLYEVECEHVFDESTCRDCGPLSPIIRAERHDQQPVIHCGTIASGNQVIKHGRTRDRIASESGVICFEMEAAGLMDYLPCLVIRGICDYCDSHKHKEFQPYAAITAAAYAKELLLSIPNSQIAPQQNPSTNINKDVLEHRKLVIEALNFDQAESRRATINQAHTQTCHWFLERPQYKKWLLDDSSEDSRLLWIKGKAGTGKSTLMKYVLEHIEKGRKSQSIIVASFFFNARGEDLERSTVGMYRSLLAQILEQNSDAQRMLDRIKLSTEGIQWQLTTLQNLFKQAILVPSCQKMICLIDALDECPEDEIRVMVNHFEDLCEAAASQNGYFRICFSSRHYPHISTSIGAQLVLEEQDGHQGDIESWVKSKLKIGASKSAKDLRQEVCDKSSSIFLWVVLVVRILMRQYDKGHSIQLMIQGMRQQLKSIPPELNELFRDILVRDQDNLDDLILCIQLVLYAQRPLKREEHYFGMLSANNAIPIVPWDQEEITVEVMDKYLLQTSKGLAEMTRSSKPTVQFIHESVREFLMKPGSLIDLSLQFKNIAEGVSHEQLKKCCERYMKHSFTSNFDLEESSSVTGSTIVGIEPSRARTMFPFLDYCVQNCLCHADIAARLGVPQVSFAEEFDWGGWFSIHNHLEKHGTRRIGNLLLVGYYLSTQKHHSILPLWMRHNVLKREAAIDLLDKCVQLNNLETAHSLVNCYQQNLSRCEVSNFADIDLIWALCKILYSNAILGHRDPIGLMLDWTTEVDVNELGKCLVWAAVCHHAATLDLFLRRSPHQALMPLLSQIIYHELSRGADPRSRLNCIEVLVKHGLSIRDAVQIKDTEGNTPFCQACRHGRLELVDLLLDHGASTKETGKDGLTTLHFAVGSHNIDLIRRLLDLDSSLISLLDDNGRTAFHRAVIHGRVDCFKTLLAAESKVFTRDHEGNTPLHSVVTGDQRKIKFLLSHGVPVNAANHKGETVLHIAARYGTDSTVSLLLSRKADPCATDELGRTVLHAAAERPLGLSPVVDILIRAGARVDALDHEGRTALAVASVQALDDESKATEPDEIMQALLRNGAQSDLKGYGDQALVDRLVAKLAQSQLHQEQTGEEE